MRFGKITCMIYVSSIDVWDRQGVFFTGIDPDYE